MGRGLSPEQQQILCRAVLPAAPGTPPCVDLLVRDAIEACYPDLRYLRPRNTAHEAGPGDTVWSDQSAELLRARAAIARSFRRLEDRGLVERISAACSRWSGIKLTEAGRNVAKRCRLELDPELGLTPYRSTSHRQRMRALRAEEDAAAEAALAAHFAAQGV